MPNLEEVIVRYHMQRAAEQAKERENVMIVTTGVEVHRSGGKWVVTVHTRYHGDEEAKRGKRWKTPIAKKRLKRDAVLIATGAAKVLKTELRVTNRKGQYTSEGSSYGNDPSDIPG